MLYGALCLLLEFLLALIVGIVIGMGLGIGIIAIRKFLSK
jgi:hypothetical protein